MTLETHPLYPFTKEEVQEIRSELGFKESTIAQDIDAISDWFMKQPHLVEAGLDRAYVERVLLLSKGSIEKAKRRIECYYKYRALAPEIIQNREKVLDDSKDLWTFYSQIVIPKLYKGQRITVTKFHDPDSNNFSSEIFLRNTFMLSDIKLHYDYFGGDIWVVDLKNLSVGFLLKFNPLLVQKASLIFHQGIGLRLKAIHVVNPSSFLSHIVMFMKQFLSPKLFERIVVHDTLEDLHKQLPKEYLPVDYGGELKSVAEYTAIQEKELRSIKTKAFLLDAMKIVSNEDKRLYDNFNQDYIAGSFRKLQLD